MEETPGFGRLLAHMVALLARHAPSALGSLAALTVCSTAIDLYAPELAPFLNLLVLILLMVLQYQVTHRVLLAANLLDLDSRPRVGSFVGFNIVGNLLIGLATMVLVVPGLYLLARWSAAIPIIVGEGAAMGEAMQRSGERTRGAILPAMGLMLVCSLPWAIGVAWMFWQSANGAIETSGTGLAFNLLIYSSSVATWFGSLAVHALTFPDQEDRLEAVFA